MSRRSSIVGLLVALVVFGAVAPMPVVAVELTVDGVDVPNSVSTGEQFDIEVDVFEEDTNEIDVVLGLPDQLSCSPSGSQSVSTDRGSGTATFSCTASAAGDYSGEIDVVATGTTTDGDSISDSTQTGLVVRSPASLSLTTSLDAAAVDAGGSTALTASVSNTGDDATSYELSTTTGAGLSAAVASGAASGSVDGGETVFVTYTLDGDATGDHDATVTLTGGNGQAVDATETVTVRSTGGDDGSTTTTTTTTTTSDDDEEEEEQTEAEESDNESGPTVDEVRQELEESGPTTQTSTEIADADPDRPGVNVNPEGTESVREITFDDEAASGSVDVSEYQDPPESVSESVTDAVSDASETDSDGSTVTSASVATVADIEPDSESVRESSATVTMTVDRAELDDPSDAVIVHERDDSWETLETAVVEAGDEVTLEATTESFSLFAVAEVDRQPAGNGTETTTNETETGTADNEPTDRETDDGIPGFGLTLAVAALIAAAMLARRRGD